ncbi:SusC/RagA family TonB-linked outer membrane protein [Sphingobacterium hungaricum]|uniref:SusC/RagA family TonB-linked outer membrane protein n=1 Tax=Sphingobacterium hungaricum TaxID=2082723 RepID=A0A928UV17_9SPHI|nr:SusC/RagA family TonB-linked outer membrane protein [Sphingobacterium hungaricum]MBE8713725.1 SusC/RagA family TonB-linked outer membrane protein [Sphingobacterium hungaricum]
MKIQHILLNIFFMLAMLVYSNLIFAQQSGVIISGKVTDEFDKPLFGVTILSSKGKNGTSTDMKGDFSLQLNDQSQELNIQYDGYKSQVFSISDLNNNRIKLERNIHNVDQVVQLGWDSKRRKNFGGAVSSVNGTTLEHSPVANLSMSLAGRLSGLTTQETSSELSRATTNLLVRGISSTRSLGPLIMIDGIMIPYNSAQSLEYISANEIESVSVLKDGASQAMYGILGANGVILVQTKMGKKGPINISTTLDHSIQQVTTTPIMYSSADYATMRQQAWFNDFGSESNYKPLFTEDQIEKFRLQTDSLYPNNNWYDYYFKPMSSMQRVALNVSGGNDRVRYYSNVNFMHQSGFFKTDQEDYNPNPYNVWVNFRSNLDINLNKYLKSFVRLAGNVKREHTPGEGNQTVYGSIFQLPPTMYGPITPEAYDPITGEELPTSQQVITSGDVSATTYGMLNRRGYRNHTVTNINSQIGLELDMSFLLSGLSSSALFAYQTNSVGSLSTLQDYARLKRNTTNLDELVFNPVFNNVNSPLAYSKTHSYYYHLSYQGKVNYQQQFGKHDVSAVAYWFYQNLTKTDTGAPNLFPYNRMSSALKGSYSYDDRYAVELIGGYSGSEQFARDQRYTFTPGVSLAWNVSEEAFLKNNQLLSDLRFRGSWARTATDQNGQGRFSYVDNITVNRGGYIPYLQYNINENAYGNARYAAEVSTKRNVGIDIGLFNLISLSADFFDEKMDNMMVGATAYVPEFQGIPLGNYPNINVGKFENKGLEITLEATKAFNRNTTVSVGGMYSYTRNKVISNNEVQRAEDYIHPYRSEGFSVGQAFGYLIDYSNGNGYINTADELANSPQYEQKKRLGDFLYQDLNDDGIIDDRDRVPLGTGSIPNHYYGIYSNASYKNFSLHVLFQGLAGYSRIMNGWGVHEQHFEGIYGSFHQNSWTPERYESGAEIGYPSLSTTASASHQNNEYFVYNRSYLRLKNVELSYSLENSFVQRIGAQRIVVRVSGQNLLTWHNMKSDDFGPEADSGFGAIPVYRVYNFGLNLVF